MARRRDPNSALDMFPTPPWATRALLREVPLGLERPAALRVWEPACGKGHMAYVLGETFGHVIATDVHDWGYGQRHDLDFLFATADDAGGPVDWVITNPPFKAAEAFLDKGLSVARRGVALLLRLQFLEGAGRFARVFGTDRRPAVVAPFAERVPMIEGVWDPEASSATAYAWFVWLTTPAPVTIIDTIAPGAAQRHTVLADRYLATPGEARRRRLAKAASG